MGSKVLDSARWDWWTRCKKLPIGKYLPHRHHQHISISAFISMSIWAYGHVRISSYHHDTRLWFCLQNCAWSLQCSSSSPATASSLPPASSCTLKRLARWELAVTLFWMKQHGAFEQLYTLFTIVTQCNATHNTMQFTQLQQLKHNSRNLHNSCNLHINTTQHNTT